MIAVIKLFKNHKLEAELSDRFELGVAKVNPTFHTEEFKEWYRKMIVSATNSKVSYTKAPGQLPCQWNPNGIEEMRAIFNSEG